jgi:hypothetical protein
MTVTMKTHDELIAMGLKRDYPNYYKGLKSDKEMALRYHLVDSYGGKTLQIVDVDSVERGQLLVERKGKQFFLPIWAIQESVSLDSIVSPPSIQIGRKAARFLGSKFDFPCSFQDLDTKSAVKLARWVLKMAKQAK